MRTVNRMAAQGDFIIIRKASGPVGMTQEKDDGGVFVIAHSETGHNHVIDSRNAQLFIDETNEFIAHLSVTEESEIRHLRDFDTHETLLVPPGEYEIRRQREYVPEGYRRAAD